MLQDPDLKPTAISGLSIYFSGSESHISSGFDLSLITLPGDPALCHPVKLPFSLWSAGKSQVWLCGWVMLQLSTVSIARMLSARLPNQANAFVLAPFEIITFFWYSKTKNYHGGKQTTGKENTTELAVAINMEPLASMQSMHFTHLSPLYGAGQWRLFSPKTLGCYSVSKYSPITATLHPQHHQCRSHQHNGN